MLLISYLPKLFKPQSLSREANVNFRVGDSVIVKQHGVQDPDLGIDIGGWQGRISEVIEKNSLVCIDWDSSTLAGMSESIIAKCEEEGLSWSRMNLEATEVELATPRDTEEDVAQMISEIEAKHPWDYLGEEGQRISNILADVDPEDEWEAFEAWEAHLERVLRFPFEAEVVEVQERGPLRTGDGAMVKGITETVDLYGVIVEVRTRRGTYEFPLCDLEATDRKSSNYEQLRAYVVWFANR